MSEMLSRDKAILALRAAADLIESLPDIPRWFVECEAYNMTAEQLAAAAAVPGGWDKDPTDVFFRLVRDLHGLPFTLHGDREEVCRAVPTGRKVTKPKLVAAAVYEDVEVDEVEWVCEPLLSKATVE